jgi:hypothetical protein
MSSSSDSPLDDAPLDGAPLDDPPMGDEPLDDPPMGDASANLGRIDMDAVSSTTPSPGNA